METKFKNEYTVEIQKYSTETYEHFSEDGIEDFLAYFDGDTFDSDEELAEAFSEYIRDNEQICPEPGENTNIDDYSTNFEITNWNDIFPLLKHMVEIPAPRTCCDDAPRHANFCPTCGKPIVKD